MNTKTDQSIQTLRTLTAKEMALVSGGANFTPASGKVPIKTVSADASGYRYFSGYHDWDTLTCHP
ncbi:MAG: hypothetical protein ABL925_18630 [Methylococcales bacterium]